MSPSPSRPSSATRSFAQSVRCVPIVGAGQPRLFLVIAAILRTSRFAAGGEAVRYR